MEPSTRSLPMMGTPTIERRLIGSRDRSRARGMHLVHGLFKTVARRVRIKSS